MLNNMTAYALLSKNLLIFPEAPRYHQRSVPDLPFPIPRFLRFRSMTGRVITLLSLRSAFLVSCFSLNDSLFIL